MRLQDTNGKCWRTDKRKRARLCDAIILKCDKKSQKIIILVLAILLLLKKHSKAEF